MRPHHYVGLLILSTPLTLAAQTDMQLSAGTRVPIVNVAQISSATAKKGDHFKLAVDSDVKVFGVSLIVKGAPVWGTVTNVKAAGNMGHGGSLSLTADSVQAIDGQSLVLTNSTGSAASNVIFTANAGDAGTFGMFRKGTDVVYKAGVHLALFTVADVVIHVPDNALKPAATADSAHAHLDSTPPPPPTPAPQH